MVKRKTHNAQLIFSYSALGIIGILILTMFYPVANISYADDGTDSATTYVSADVLPVISLALPSTMRMAIEPTVNGNFGSATGKLLVATNSSDGYTLYMSTGDNTANLKSIDSTNTAVIKPVAANSKASEFAANSWGYSLDSGQDKTYQPVAAGNSGESTSIKTTTTNNPKDEYDLTFGAFINSELPIGQYSNSVVISVVANPVTITSFSQLTYMQNMTSEICANTAEGSTKQLIDTRDGNSYWVEKLKDGNCWMTQNLALNLTEKGLSPVDSDISAEWNSRSTYPPQATNAVHLDLTRNAYKYQDTNSWSWGDKTVLAMPEAGNTCNKSITSDDNIGEMCAEVGFVDVSGDEWKPTFVAKQGTFVRPSGLNYNGLIAVDQEAKTYDAHYLIGNYYQYNTATAGTGYGGEASGVLAPESICPKGWTLPEGSADTSGSRFYLLKTYGLASRGQYGDSGSLTSGNYNIAAAPLYFVRSGYVIPYSGALVNLGVYGVMWSGTRASTGEGIMLEFSKTSLTAARSSYTTGGGYNSMATGEPIRCIAR